MNEFKRRKSTRLSGANYNRNGAIFLTICTKDRRCILSRIISAVGTGVPDGPENSHVIDAPAVGTDVPDGPRIELTKYGQIADKYINQLSNFYDNLSVESYVIMPNHIHIMLWVKSDLPQITKAPDLQESTRSEASSHGKMSETPTHCGPSRTPVPTAATTLSTIQNSIPSRFISTFKRFCNKECGGNIWQYRSYDHIIRSSEDYEEHLKYIYENPIRWYYDELYAEE